MATPTLGRVAALLGTREPKWSMAAMKRGILPSFMRCVKCDDLVRLGRDNDGGYLVSDRDVMRTDLLIALGVNNDWSFEEDFVARHACPIAAYDGTISGSQFLKSAIRRSLRIRHPKALLARWSTYFGYKRFFAGERKHIKKNVDRDDGASRVSMKRILSEQSQENVFVKVDIEGSEYAVMEDLIREQARFTGMVIEFHDCDIHLDRIKDFIEGIRMPLVNVHANNFGKLTENGLPRVLELSFSGSVDRSANSDVAALPHPLDMPNNPEDEEISLSFRL